MNTVHTGSAYNGPRSRKILGSTRQHGVGAQPGERAHVEQLLGKANAAGREAPFMSEKTAQALDRQRDRRDGRKPGHPTRLTLDGTSDA